MHPLTRLTCAVALAALVSLASAPVPAGPGGLDIDITGTGLDELFDVDITSVSRTEEHYQASAAAIFIVTAEDIARSGVTSVPEALRLVPGVQVSKVDGSKWAVSIRGFHARTSNKLLVMIDGRSVYNPLFAGVLWEARDVLLEEIEQIEVVRGPGGALWGANAVNGVINIITKHAEHSQGSMVVTGGGVEERAFAAARHGWSFGRTGHARAYAKWFDRDGGRAPAGDAGDAGDDWSMTRVGFRADWGGDRSRFTVQGDAFAGEVGEPLGDGTSQDVDHDGGNLSVNWRRSGTDGSRAVRAFYDRTRLDNLALGETRDTIDVEYQEDRTLGRRSALLWGLGWRRTMDEIVNGPVLEVDPTERDDDIVSAFAQGVVPIGANGRLRVGTKVEHNQYTDTEIQPSLRVSWIPDADRTLWASVSRAVRTPSRLEVDLVQPIRGPTNPRSEELWAHEAGFRWRPTPSIALDTAVFWNRYDELLTLEGSELGNELAGDTYGLETNLAVQLRPWWRLHAAASVLRLDLELNPGSSATTPASFVEGMDPRHQLSLRMVGDVRRADLELDATLRHVDDLPSIGVDAYTALDLRVGWRPSERLSLSLVGRNVLDAHHAEQAGPTTTEVEPSVFLRLRLDF